MCLIRYIKDLLFPTNVLGKKMRTFTLPMIHPPYVSKTFNIVWSGEYLQVKRMQYLRPDHLQYKTRRTPIEEHFTYGDMTNVELIVYQGHVGGATVFSNNVYLKCINVTYLEINGERYI